MNNQENPFQQVYNPEAVASDVSEPLFEDDSYDNLPEEPASPSVASEASVILSNIETVANDQPHEITETDTTIPPVTQGRASIVPRWTDSANSERYVSRYLEETDGRRMVIIENYKDWTNLYNSTLISSNIADNGTAVSVNTEKISFEEYINSPDRINSETLIEFILEIKGLVNETTKKILECDKALTIPDLVLPIIKESEKLLSKLNSLKNLVESMGESGLTSENKSNVISEISDASSLFFTMAKAWKEDQNKFNYTKEEEEDVGKMLADYIDLADRRCKITGNVVKEIHERINDYSKDICRCLKNSRSPLTNRFAELSEAMCVKLFISTNSYTAIHLPATEYLLWNIIQGNDELKEKYRREDCTRIFKALIREGKNGSPFRTKVFEAISQKLLEIISDKLKNRSSSVIDYKKFLDSPVIKASIELYSTDEIAEAFVISFKVINELSFAKYLKPIKDRSHLYRFLEAEMIKPFQKFNKENCMSLLSGLKAKFNCVTDYPINEVYVLIKTLSPLFSFSECRQTCSYAMTMVQDFQFTITVRSNSLRALQLLNMIFSFVEEIDPGSNEFMLNITNDSYSIAAPVEFMIKILGYRKFSKFLSDRRTTEVNALLAALAYKDTFSAPNTLLPGFWNDNEFIKTEEIYYRLMRFSKNTYFSRPKLFCNTPWNKNILDYIRYKDWKKLDFEDEAVRMKKFEDNLNRAITEGFQTTFLPTEIDKKFFDVHMRLLLRVFKMASPKSPLRYNGNFLMERLKYAILKIINNKERESSKHSKVEYFEALRPVIEKHPIFYPLMTDILNFIQAENEGIDRNSHAGDAITNTDEELLAV